MELYPNSGATVKATIDKTAKRVMIIQITFTFFR
jgi:hypothetical protein